MENHVVVAWGTPVNTLVYAFYGHQLHSEWRYTPGRHEVPEGALLYYPSEPDHKSRWFSMDLCPVLLVDVPKPVRALVLLMGI